MVESVASWLISNNNESSLVDLISGKTLLSGYSGYRVIAVPGSMLYVYASIGSGYDIYTIK